MREGGIKLTCDGVKVKKQARDGDEENLLAPELVKINGPSEKTTVRISIRQTKMDVYFAAIPRWRDQTASIRLFSLKSGVNF